MDFKPRAFVFTSGRTQDAWGALCRVHGYSMTLSCDRSSSSTVRAIDTRYLLSWPCLTSLGGMLRETISEYAGGAMYGRVQAYNIPLRVHGELVQPQPRASGLKHHSFSENICGRDAQSTADLAVAWYAISAWPPVRMNGSSRSG